MKRVSAIVMVLVLILSVFISASASEDAHRERAKGPSTNVPVWEKKEQWRYYISYNPNKQTTIQGITITYNHYTEDTTQTVNGTKNYGGYQCYELYIVSYTKMIGTWSAGGMSGMFTDKGMSKGNMYYRTSDLAFVGGNLQMNGTQTYSGIGVSETYTVTATITTDTPTATFKFPMNCTSPNQTWHVYSTQTISVSGTTGSGTPISDTSYTTYDYNATVIGYESHTVPAGTFNCFVIDINGTKNENGDVSDYKGKVYFAPDAKRDIADTTCNAKLTHLKLNLPMPDLVISNQDISIEGAPSVGSKIKINATIKNLFHQGHKMIDATNITVRFFDDMTQIGEDILIKRINVNDTGVASVEWEPDTEGIHTIRVIVDPDNTIKEIKEDNNNASIDIEVTKPLPDLIVTPQNISVSEELPMGVPVAIKATIYNQGTLDASDIPITFYIGSKRIGDVQTIKSIKIGEEEEASVVWVPDALGEKKITVKVDETNVIEEVRDDNNEASITVVVVQPPYQFTITPVDVSVQVMPGEMKIVKFTVKNVGLNADTIVLSITGPSDWAPSVNPSNIGISSGSRRDFTVSVMPPSDARAGQNASFTITAVSSGNNTLKSEVHIECIVMRKDDLSVKSVEEKVYAKPGKDVIYEFVIENRGNAPDSYNLDVESQMNWLVRIVGEETTDIINPGESVKVKVRSTVPRDAKAGDMDEVTLTATSKNNRTLEDKASVSVEAEQVYGIEISLSTSRLKILPGDSESFTVKITNTGNGLDTIKLSVTGEPEIPSEWTIDYENMIRIDAGKTKEVIVSISPDEEAHMGKHTLSVTAESSEKTISDSKNIQVEILQVFKCSIEINTPDVSVFSGKVAVITLTITNLGNGKDTFKLSIKGLDPSYDTTFSDNDFELKKGENAEISLTIKVPTDAKGDVQITISVKSQGGYTDEGTATLHIKSKKVEEQDNTLLIYGILGAVIAAAVIGGGIYYWRRKKA